MQIVQKVQSVHDTLAERNGTHGDFREQAGLNQALAATMRAGRNWERLTPTQKHALEMIAVKMSRILTGDPNNSDGWHDIAGYATLVERELTQ